MLYEVINSVDIFNINDGIRNAGLSFPNISVIFNSVRITKTGLCSNLHDQVVFPMVV
jgi:hypothetical protein